MRTAQLAMMVAEYTALHDGRENFSRLPPSIQYLLAAPSTPEDVREQVLASFSDGLRFKVNEVKDLIRAAKGRATRRVANPTGAAEDGPSGEDAASPERNSQRDATAKNYTALDDQEDLRTPGQPRAMAEPAGDNEDAAWADDSSPQVSTRKLEAATGNPEKQALIQSIRTIVRRLPQPYRANLICYLSKLGDVPAAALADCMQ